MAFKVLDLFSGAGGLSRGFYDAGYEVVLGVDFDKAALKTFKENHGQEEAMNLDLFDHDNIDVIIDFLKYLRYQELSASEQRLSLHHISSSKSVFSICLSIAVMGWIFTAFSKTGLFWIFRTVVSFFRTGKDKTA